MLFNFEIPLFSLLLSIIIIISNIIIIVSSSRNIIIIIINSSSILMIISCCSSRNIVIIIIMIISSSRNIRKQKDKWVLGPCKRTKKKAEHEVEGDTDCTWYAWNGLQRLREKRLAEVEIRGRINTRQTSVLLRLARILRGVLETWGDLLSLRLQCKTTS